MRTRQEIMADGRIKADLQLEVLIDLRDLLVVQKKAAKKPQKRTVKRTRRPMAGTKI